MTPREEMIDQILNAHRDFSRRMSRGIPQEWLETEITMSQFKTLLVLWGMGSAPMGALAEALGTGVSTLTGIVDRLVEQGLVARAEDPRDRRVVVARPTPAGLALVDRLIVAARGRLNRVLDELNDDEIWQALIALRLLSAALERSLNHAAPSPH